MLGAKLITSESLTTTKATFRENSFIQSLKFSFLPFLVILFGYNFSFKSQNNVPSILGCLLEIVEFDFAIISVLQFLGICFLILSPNFVLNANQGFRVFSQPSQECFKFSKGLLAALGLLHYLNAIDKYLDFRLPNFMVDSNNHSCEFKDPRLFFLNKHVLFLIMNKTCYELIFSEFNFFFSVFNVFVMKLFPLISLQKTSRL